MIRKLDIFTIVLAGFLAFLLVITILSMFYTPTSDSGEITRKRPRAIIVDSLGSNFINKKGIFEIIKILYNAGFIVDVKIGAELLRSLFIEKKSIQEAILTAKTRAGTDYYKSDLLVETRGDIGLDDKIWVYYFKPG
ncbi:MAG: hypothetical protein DRJ38_05305 [Thermoprotei archaeon]|nr:MAG: hypothetical protein DRJ38_05305 [Thermoprotei archaeon]